MPNPRHADAGRGVGDSAPPAPPPPEAALLESLARARASVEVLLASVIGAFRGARGEVAEATLGLAFGFACGFALSAALTPDQTTTPTAQAGRARTAAAGRPSEALAPAPSRTPPSERGAPRLEDYGYPGLPYAVPLPTEPGPADGSGRQAPVPTAETPGYASRRPWGEMRPLEEKPRGPSGASAPEATRLPSPYPYPGAAEPGPWGATPYYPALPIDPYGSYPYGAGYR